MSLPADATAISFILTRDRTVSDAFYWDTLGLRFIVEIAPDWRVSSGSGDARWRRATLKLSENTAYFYHSMSHLHADPR